MYLFAVFGGRSPCCCEHNLAARARPGKLTALHCPDLLGTIQNGWNMISLTKAKYSESPSAPTHNNGYNETLRGRGPVERTDWKS